MTRASDTARILSGGVVINEDSNDVDLRVESNGNANMLLVDGGNDAVVVGQSAADTTVIGTTPPLQVIGSGGNSFITVTNRQASDSGPHIALTKSRNTSVGSHTIVQSGDTVGAIVFQADDGTNLDSRAAEIRCKIDTTPGENDVPGRLEFLTTADGANSPTEHMRIDDGGQVFFGCTSTSSGVPNESGIVIQGNGNQKYRAATNGNAVNQFYNGDGSLVGSIVANASSTTFNTSSDYRLKENVTYDFNATTRLKQLKPSRFNFKNDTDNTVDGFLAHEVSSIVPEAIVGKKDEVDDAGNPVYQGIDQSKLVPLLVKTIQELEARITTLESK